MIRCGYWSLMSWYIGVIDLNVYIGFRVVMVLFIGVNWELLFIFYVYLNGLDISLEFLFEIVFIYVIKIFNLIYLIIYMMVCIWGI